MTTAMTTAMSITMATGMIITTNTTTMAMAKT
jgi:hypothetical protein